MARNDDALLHLDWARRAEQNGDFLAARVEYMKCVESWRQFGDVEELAKASNEYEQFVHRDPIFERLVSKLLPLIQANPGLLQSEITKRADTVDWSGLYNYQRPVAKDDIYYALYFAAKFNMITRVKKGRSYELTVCGGILSG